MSRTTLPDISLCPTTLVSPQTASQQQIYVKVFSRYNADVVRLLRGMLTDKQEAEDIAQEVLVRIINMREPEKLQQNPKAYLFQIATNLVRDRIRQQHSQKRAHISAENTNVEQLSAPASSPEQVLNMAQTLDSIQTLLQGLPNEDRRIFVWCKMYNLSTQEISKRMDLPLRTVQRRLTNVISRIALLLERRDD